MSKPLEGHKVPAPEEYNPVTDPENAKKRAQTEQILARHSLAGWKPDLKGAEENARFIEGTIPEGDKD